MQEVENVLAHYGIKGMKWGVRRRRDSSTGRVDPDASDDFKAAIAAKSKPASHLSNQEMQALITRMNLEKQYLSAMTPSVPPTRKAKTTKFVKDLLLDIGRTEVQRVAKGAVQIAIESQLKTAKGGKYAPVAARIKPKKG